MKKGFKQYRGKRVTGRWKGGGKKVKYQYMDKTGKMVTGFKYSNAGFKSGNWNSTDGGIGSSGNDGDDSDDDEISSSEISTSGQNGTRTSKRTEVKKYSRRVGWSVIKTDDPHTWWSFRQ